MFLSFEYPNGDNPIRFGFAVQSFEYVEKSLWITAPPRTFVHVPVEGSTDYELIEITDIHFDGDCEPPCFCVGDVVVEPVFFPDEMISLCRHIGKPSFDHPFFPANSPD